MVNVADAATPTRFTVYCKGQKIETKKRDLLFSHLKRLEAPVEAAWKKQDCASITWRRFLKVTAHKTFSGACLIFK